MSQQINLLRASPQSKPSSHASANSMLAVLGIAAIACIAAAVYAQQRLHHVQREAQTVEAALKQARADHARLAEEHAARKPSGRDAELAALVAQLSNRQHIVDTLKGGSIGTTSGFSEYMRAFSRRDLSGLWLTGFDLGAGGTELTLKGRAISPAMIPSYLQDLDREPSLKGRSFASVLITGAPPAASSATAEQQRADELATAAPAAARYVEFVVSSAVAAPTKAAHADKSEATSARATSAQLLDLLSGNSKALQNERARAEAPK